MSGQEIRTITIKLPQSEREILDEYCAQERRTISEILREHIRSLKRKLKKRKENTR